MCRTQLLRPLPTPDHGETSPDHVKRYNGSLFNSEYSTKYFLKSSSPCMVWLLPTYLASLLHTHLHALSDLQTLCHNCLSSFKTQLKKKKNSTFFTLTLLLAALLLLVSPYLNCITVTIITWFLF